MRSFGLEISLEPQLCLATNFVTFLAILESVFLSAKIGPTPVFWGFPGGSDSKESACDVGDLGSVLGLGRFPGERNGHPL